MENLEVHSLLTNNPFEETIAICANAEMVESLLKIEFKKLLSLATKESYFTFNGKLYKQVDGPIGSILANVYFEKNWIQNCPSDFKCRYYRRYVDIFLFTSPKHLEAFQNFLNGRHAHISFAIENEKQSRMSFLDAQVIREDKTFTNVSTVHLVEFINILTASYHLPVSLVLLAYLFSWTRLVV